ncbi:MAG: hypothetical protein JNL01_05250 [Bdellovibrionales bacterium]|nr:hypothetical protein [Bdellovibrionales bacterium]
MKNRSFAPLAVAISLGTFLASSFAHAYSTYPREFVGKILTFQRDVDLDEEHFISAEIGTEGVGYSMSPDGVMCEFSKGWAHLAHPKLERDFFGPGATLLDESSQYEITKVERNTSSLKDSEGYPGTISVILRLEALDPLSRPSQVFLYCWSANYGTTEDERLFMAQFDLERTLNHKKKTVKFRDGPRFEEKQKPTS